MPIHDIAKTERIEMYLKAVYSLSHADPPVTIAKVARYMGVASPSSYEMLRRLERRRLLRESSLGYRLTPEGLQIATRVVRRLRLAERLLTDVLRLDLAQVYAEACKLEHVISAEVEGHLDEVLGHPESCPHGLPIPGNSSEASVTSLVTLDRLEVWNRAIVASIPEEEEALVRHLGEVGLLPNAAVLVREVGPSNDPITVQVGHQIRAISADVARRVRVRPAE